MLIGVENYAAAKSSVGIRAGRKHVIINEDINNVKPISCYVLIMKHLKMI